METTYSRELNVMDEYKGLDPLEIKSRITSLRFPYAVMMEQWQGDFNFGTLIRNANVFGANEVFYVGKRKYDKRGTVGTHHYVDITYIEPDTLEDAIATLRERYVLVALDNNIQYPVQDIRTFQWPENALMVFGEEKTGITPRLLEMCDLYVSIPQFGSVRSLNCGTASGITMFDYVTKNTQ